MAYYTLTYRYRYSIVSCICNITTSTDFCLLFVVWLYMWLPFMFSMVALSFRLACKMYIMYHHIDVILILALGLVMLLIVLGQTQRLVYVCTLSTTQQG